MKTLAATQQSIVGLLTQMQQTQQLPIPTNDDSASTKVMNKMFEKSAVTEFVGKWPRDNLDAFE